MGVQINNLGGNLYTSDGDILIGILNIKLAIFSELIQPVLINHIHEYCIDLFGFE